jgi:hypothetical protein
MGCLLGVVGFVVVVVAEVGVVKSWMEGHDHSAIGWMIVAGVGTLICSAAGAIAKLRN